ncbi:MULTISPECIES: DUF805 domain-containing protein [Rhizobium]|uniref:DUF805 domain-containing protein n=1 Tax=Rhizobium TaxID=379 RepID=UPI00184ACD33|nr:MULTISPECIES: DUF805 domain-containing protein [Rhizobium]MDF0657951.1 DUF805 domain-containing protein [Rhizobium sp. BC49]ULJ77080.1 DUF805 domain-containing protein [Rhizobium sp. C104]
MFWPPSKSAGWGPPDAEEPFLAKTKPVQVFQLPFDAASMQPSNYERESVFLDQLQGGTVLKTFSLRGRLGRLRYFLFTLAVIIIAAAAVFVLTRLLTLAGTREAFSIVQGLIALTYVLAIIASFCLMARRLHDFDQSGWWTLSVLVLHLVYSHYEAAGSLTATILMGIVLLAVHLAIILTPGSKNPNRFGELPGSVAAPV